MCGGVKTLQVAWNLYIVNAFSLLSKKKIWFLKQSQWASNLKLHLLKSSIKSVITVYHCHVTRNSCMKVNLVLPAYCVTLLPSEAYIRDKQSLLFYLFYIKHFTIRCRFHSSCILDVQTLIRYFTGLSTIQWVWKMKFQMIAKLTKSKHQDSSFNLCSGEKIQSRPACAQHL